MVQGVDEHWVLEEGREEGRKRKRRRKRRKRRRRRKVGLTGGGGGKQAVEGLQVAAGKVHVRVPIQD